MRLLVQPTYSTTGQDITNRYGEIRNCLKLENSWIILTLGTPADRTVARLGVYSCSASNTACADGAQPHPYSGWTWIKPRYPGALTYLARLSTGDLVLDDGGHQVIFDPATQQFTDG